MKPLIYFFAFCLVLGNVTVAQSTDENQVAAAVEKLKKAMLDGNKSELENITADALSYGHSAGKIEDKAAFVEALASGKSDFITINLADQTIKIIGNTAIVRHILTGENIDAGKPGKVNIGVLLMWQKMQGKWKLLARQAYKL